jgi:putative ABC transport system ATP-binding protein
MKANDVMTTTTAGLGASPAPPGTPSTSAPIAVRAEQAVKLYGRGDTAVRALDGVTLALPAGRFTAIMGPSGSGKSTLMHCLAGLDTLTSGRVYVGDVDLGRLSERELTRLRRDHIGFVFQAFNLLPMLSAGENITLPLDLAGRKSRRRRASAWPDRPGGEAAKSEKRQRRAGEEPDKRWVQGIVDTVGLGDRLKHRPSELSGGQQQRVAIARALASRPSVIFADEPTGNLDSRSGGEILAFMRRAVDDLGQTIVMVTHDPVAASYADAVVFLADGRIVDQLVAPTAERVLERLGGLASGPDPRPERPGAEHREREAQRRSPSGPSPQATRAGSTAEFGS